MSASRDDGANPKSGSMKSRRPYGVACTTCRRAKMKCIASNPEVDRCDRCVRLQRDCEYEPHRRGLWRRERLDKGLRDHNQGSGGDSGHPTTGLPETRETTGPPEPLVVPRRSDRDVFSEGYAVVPGGETLAPELPRSQPGANSAQFMPHSFIAKSEDTRGLSLATVLDPDKGMLTAVVNSDKPLDTDISKGTPWDSDDPINIGLISQPSGQYLFEGFFKHFNCLVGLLDPQLYTFSYTRGTSSLLFSIILAISARVFQPESYEPIQKHSEILLGRALVACDIAIENIWAILCMYHWKDVDDTRGYTLLGFATRMAASAQWNKFGESMAPGNEPLVMAQTEAQVRQRRDKERIWLVLGNVDRTSSLFTDRPLATQMINKEIGARIPNPEPFQLPLLYFFRDYTRLYFNSVLLHRLLVAHHSNNISRDRDVANTIQLCFSCALSVLQQVAEMGKLDILYFLWDTAHLMTAYSAMMVLKLLSQPGHVPPVLVREAFEVLAEVSHLYSTAASSLRTADSDSLPSMGGKVSPSSPAGVQARLLGAILARLKSEFQIAENETSGELSRDTLDLGMLPTQSEEQPIISSTSAQGEGLAYNPLAISTAEPSRTPALGVNSMMDGDFMDSWFTLAGLMSWDEPGIFIEPH
ncbi:hypothetical protein MRS44_003755 [Fusarium solani]|uniref:uncharacterized protein n=1 Tax=Fusarium solani TaxID=169388 RepID=UPI0032C3E278|nr:hypothetical protein MRS44_003755 [Fusarium solani]